jgi:hypothetical protein
MFIGSSSQAHHSSALSQAVLVEAVSSRMKGTLLLGASGFFANKKR